MENEAQSGGRRYLPMLAAVAAAGVAGAVIALLATGKLSFGSEGEAEAEIKTIEHAPVYVSGKGTLRDYWTTPIHPQPAQPEGMTEYEADLRPVICGSCHLPQLEAWKGSRHSMATGPGIHAQMLEYNRTKPLKVPDCSSCHYPLWEQHPTVTSDGAPNPSYNQELYESGVSCAVCHVRNKVWHGPPRSGEPPPEGQPVPHQGFVVEEFFSESRFCARCHQFRPGGFALNGKLIENTYEEWKASKWADEGMQCQGCHMPDRQHLFRGIHDPEMTRKAVTITLAPIEKAEAGGKTSLTVANTGAGHHFPTYVTPAVYIRFHVEKDGEKVDGSEVEHRIQRRVPINLKKEEEDTRIPAGGEATFDYSWTADGDTLVVKVVADPDEFYRRFYENRLTKQKKMADDVRAQYELALQETHDNVFTVWEQKVSLTGDPQPQPQPPAPAKPEPPAKPKTADAGKLARELYGKRCAACHGPGGKGDGPASQALTPRPRDYSDPAWQKQTSDARIEKVIVEGGPAVGLSPLMPPNPDLAGKPEVVRELRAIVRSFGK